MAAVDERQPQDRQQLLLGAYRDAGLAKLPAVVEHVRALASQGGASRGKFVCFAHHLAVLDAVQAGALAHVQHIRIDGATPPAARHAAVRRFQQSPACRFALIAISAGGTTR